MRFKSFFILFIPWILGAFHEPSFLKGYDQFLGQFSPLCQSPLMLCSFSQIAAQALTSSRSLTSAPISSIDCSNERVKVGKKLIHQGRSYTYQLALTAIFQDEGPYLKEWLEFHRLVGVEHCYLYNNLSRDNYGEVLRPYIEEGFVELIDWPYGPSFGLDWNDIQCNAYMDCFKRAAGKAKWLAIVDIDEFIFPVQEDNLAQFLTKYEEVGGVCANWVLYGTSWVSKIPLGALQIEELYLRESAPNLHVKSIIRPERVKGCDNPHYMLYKTGFSQVNADGVPFMGPFSPYSALDKIRINHYWIRDECYLNEYKNPRRAMWGSIIDENYVRRLNGEPDRAIFKYIPILKERMHTGA